jgi:polar amino acid transport system permease protein
MKISQYFISQNKQDSEDSFFAKGLNIVLLFLLLTISLNLFFSAQTFDFKALHPYWMTFVKGFGMTCMISLTSLIFSFFIGTAAAFMRKSKLYIIRYVSMLYVEAIRGTPLLVQLLVFFYVIASALSLHNRFWIGVVTLSLFSGAYIAEIVRAGLDSIRSSQIETAKSLGMTSKQTYQYVIFPLVFRQILPPLTGQFASIIKDSSLLSILGISEFTYTAQQISTATYSTLESFMPLAIGYLALTLPISLLSKKIEKRFQYES